MKNFFNIDNPIFQAISRIGDLFILSFFWIITSMPLVTIGASTTAIIDVSIRILRKRDNNIVKDYFRAFKNNFRQATIIWLIMAAIGAVLYVDIIFWDGESGTNAMVIKYVSYGFAVIYALILLYVFAVQAIFDNTIKATLKTSFLLSLRHFPTSLLLLLCSGGIYYLCLYPVGIYVTMFVGVGIIAMTYSTRYLTIFRKYNSDLLPAPDELGETEPLFQFNNFNKKENVKKSTLKNSKVIK